MNEIESVEVLDPEVQVAWKQIAESKVGELTSSYVLCTAIMGLVRAGIADRLSPKWTPLADVVPPGGSADMIGRFLRYLEIRGIVQSRGDTVRLTPRGAALVDEVAESLIGYYLEAYGPVLNRMAGQLTGEETYGRDVIRDAEALGRRCEAMFRSMGSKLVSGVIAENQARSVLDLGCGTGGLLLDLCRADPELTAVGIDIAPEAVKLARERAAEEGLDSRVQFVVGDAFAPSEWPAVARDCDFFVAIGAVHEHFRQGGDAVAELLGRYGELLARPGKKAFLLAEPELYVDATDADFYLVHVLTAQGMPRPRSRWLEVISRSGLTCRRVFSAPNTGFRFAYYELTAA